MKHPDDALTRKPSEAQPVARWRVSGEPTHDRMCQYQHNAEESVMLSVNFSASSVLTLSWMPA